jgi:hypothetical protein
MGVILRQALSGATNHPGIGILTQSQLLADIKSLIEQPIVYGLGSIGLKASGVFLILLYTR